MYNSDFFACNKQIGRYRIIKEIGRGGTSSVFLCVDNHIGKKWAMKLILPEKGNKDMYTSEIATLKSLDYYMFPRITDAFSVGDKIAIVTDYIEGENLESYLIREGPLSIYKTIEYFEELVKALIYLHNRDPGILYLDMKPSNIMILPTGEIRLIDFGIAAFVLTKGNCFGSPGYAAPEQYERNRVLTEKTDIYALGMTALAMVTGRVSWDSSDVSDVKRSIRQSLAKTGRKNKKLKMLLKLIERCLIQDDSKRMGTAEVLAGIKRIRSEDRRIIKVMMVASFIGVLFAASLYLIIKNFKISEQEMYSQKMLKEASQYVSDGEYTHEGIRIICGYIDGNFLDENTKEKYSYEVAKYYFEVLRDYSIAKHYFSNIDNNRYPEIEYYIRLCRCMSEFSQDFSEIEKCVEKLETMTRSLTDSERKSNNLELIRFIREEILLRR